MKVPGFHDSKSGSCNTSWDLHLVVTFIISAAFHWSKQVTKLAQIQVVVKLTLHLERKNRKGMLHRVNQIGMGGTVVTIFANYVTQSVPLTLHYYNFQSFHLQNVLTCSPLILHSISTPMLSWGWRDCLNFTRKFRKHLIQDCPSQILLSVFSVSWIDKVFENHCHQWKPTQQ